MNLDGQYANERFTGDNDHDEEMQVPDSNEFKENPKSEVISNVARASVFVSRTLMSWALTIREDIREDYFDPRNQDEWVRRFCEQLAEKQRKSAEVRASND